MKDINAEAKKRIAKEAEEEGKKKMTEQFFLHFLKNGYSFEDALKETNKVYPLSEERAKELVLQNK